MRLPLTQAQRQYRDRCGRSRSPSQSDGGDPAAGPSPIPVAVLHSYLGTETGCDRCGRSRSPSRSDGGDPAAGPNGERFAAQFKPLKKALSISIVIYKPNVALLECTLDSVRTAVDALRAQHGALPVCVYLVNNDPESISERWRAAFKGTEIHFEVIQGQGNIGYGRGNNLAIERAQSQYHLILNPDVELAADALVQALHFFESHPLIALIAPHVCGRDGVTQYLCRRSPTLFDLWLRGFAPACMRARFERRLAHYELRALIDMVQAQLQSSAVAPLISPPIVSGCFMLFRTHVLKELGGFDPRYFLYFEDYDLSLRAQAITDIAYVPTVRIRHFGGDAATKGGRHIRLFIVSAIRFFNRFGWKWF